MKVILATLVAVAVLGVAAVGDAKMLAVGDAFPAWKLADQNGKPLSSSELTGKTYLMWFYPKAMTPGCTAEGQALRDEFASFRAKGVEILGVSFDEPSANAAFVAAEGLPFPLLSDRERTLAVAVGAADAPDQPAARRISYLVGPDGTVVRAYESVTPASHAGQVLKDLGETKTPSN